MRPAKAGSYGMTVTVNGSISSFPPPHGLSPCEGRAAGGRKKYCWRGGRTGVPAPPPRRLAGTLALPLLLELGRRQVAQRRVDPLDVVHRLDEAAELLPGIGEIAVLGQGDFFLLDRSHQPLGVAVL